MTKKEAGLKSIPTSRFSRTVKLTGLSASLGLGSMFGASKVKQATLLVEKLSEMKGAAMKVGQMLSLHGEHLFPKEVVAVLSRLQSDSGFMAFSRIDEVMKNELGIDYAKLLLDFSKEPIASASIGQVHKACLEDGTLVAVKVQYPGVAKSIDSDVDSMGTLFRIVAALPSGEDFSEVLNELKEVLKVETDYTKEAESMTYFRHEFADLTNVLIPEVFAQVSTGRVLTTALVRGVTVKEFANSNATQELRNRIGLDFLTVFYRELFRLGVVQTDPNFGNYKILTKEQKLVLLDFGAVRRFDDGWRKDYVSMIKATYLGDDAKVIDAAVRLGFLRADDTESCKGLHLELCRLFLEPFQEVGPYDFRQSTLPQRMKSMVPRMIAEFKFRAPPRQIIFLNRKMVGVYLFLSTIGARVDVKPLLEEYLDV